MKYGLLYFQPHTLIALLMLLGTTPHAFAQEASGDVKEPVSIPIDIHAIKPPENPTIADIDLARDQRTSWQAALEEIPTALSAPNDRLASLFARLLRAEHDHVITELDNRVLGLQPIPDRPPLLLEWNESFLGSGELAGGIETVTGAVWRPSLWVFGEFRTAFGYFDTNQSNHPVADWANRLDLFGQINLSGTERILVGLRPLDEERGGSRNFTGYDLHNGLGTDAANARFQTLFFEGDFGEIFPRLDPFDSKLLDFGFSIGRMPLLAQQGLLINEDMIDAVTVTRNTLNGHGNLNFRATGVYSWRGINRNSPISGPNDFDPESKMVAFLTESDFAKRTVNLDFAYVDGSEVYGDLIAFGLSSIHRIHGSHNTYNTSLHFLASFPTDGVTNYADQGELFFAQTSWTPHKTEDLIFLNAFLAVDQFTSPTRGPAMGGPLGQTGILFSGVGLGQFGAPLAVRTSDVAGASLGYQLFFDHTRQQVIWEFGGFQETKGLQRTGAGTALRYQRAVGQHTIFVLDGFASKQLDQPVGQGARCEFRFKF